MYDIVIVGAGGMGRECCEVAQDIYGGSADYRVRGFLSDVPGVLDGFDVPPLLGPIRDYAVQPQDRFVLAIGDVPGRRKVAEYLLARGAKFLRLVHPTAHVFKSASLGEGVIVFPQAFVGANAHIGDFCLINCHAGCGHDVVMGRFTEQAPYSTISGKARTGEECFLAVHAVVAPGTVLGDRVVVSQGSTVSHRTPDDCLIAGVPGKRLRHIVAKG